MGLSELQWTHRVFKCESSGDALWCLVLVVRKVLLYLFSELACGDDGWEILFVRG